MRTARWLPAALLLLTLLPAARAAQQDTGTRTVHGVVLDASDQPIPSAIVYLTNTRTSAVRTYIADRDGKYIFHALEPNTTYELFAEFQQHRSPTRSVSSYDSRTDVPLDLKVPIT